ncbi:ankyrin repeat-containing domain protein [Aspergillus carlsbadensis]|nr:ankyrin repeat-containing domain protein [Aspergillus carlsbadensis]
MLLGLADIAVVSPPTIRQKTISYNPCIDVFFNTGLVRAVGIGSLSATCCFLSLPRVNVHVRNEAGQTILHVAAQQPDKFYVMMILLRDGPSADDCRLLDILLRRNDIDVNMADVQGKTAFFYAVDGGHKEAVKKLLDDARLDPNLTSHDLSPLAIVAGSGLMELLEMLLSDHRVAVNSQIHGSVDPLIWALFQGSEGSSLRLLCAPNVNVNCCCGTMSALMWAVILKQTEVVVEILKHDQIDVNHRDNAGRTALMLAIEEGNDEVSMALMNRKDINLTLKNIREENALDMH